MHSIHRQSRNVQHILTLIRRSLSVNQMATALRPFYFAVHPDLFGQFPKQRAVNENSLKQLHNYLERLHQQHDRAGSCDLRFYIRSDSDVQDGDEDTLDLYPGAQEQKFQEIDIQLQSSSVHDAVKTVLTSCNLPLDYIEKVKVASKEAFPRPIKWDPTFYSFYNIPNPYAERSKKPEVTLGSWLQRNVSKAREKQERAEPIREETELLCESLIKDLGLVDVRWEHGWGYKEFRACLGGFLRLYEHNKKDIDLKGHTLVFGTETGVSLTGDIRLRGDDVPQNWLPLLRSVHTHKDLLDRLPAMENEVSRLLNNVKVIRRKCSQVITAREYMLQLSHVISQLKSYQRGYREVRLPRDLSDIHLVVDCATGPIALSPQGEVIIPSYCAVFLIYDFLGKHADEARSLREESEREQKKEQTVIQKCKETFELRSLKKDKNITSSQMQKCCKRLLRDHFTNIRISLAGCRIKVAHFYSVMSDGEMCIQWNWKESQDMS